MDPLQALWQKVERAPRAMLDVTNLTPQSALESMRSLRYCLPSVTCRILVAGNSSSKIPLRVRTGALRHSQPQSLGAVPRRLLALSLESSTGSNISSRFALQKRLTRELSHLG